MTTADGPEQRIAEANEHYAERLEEYEHDLADLLRDLSATPFCMAEPHWKYTDATHCFACGEEL